MSVHNEISGGVFFHPVVQGEVVNLQLPPAIAPALSGLPPASPAFTGRDAELAAVLADLAPDVRDHPGTAPVAVTAVTAVAGLAGVGKTELAVQAAAKAVHDEGWFPGGVLFVDLFGYDPARRVTPEQALDGLLRAVGVPGEHVPPTVQDRSRLLRSALDALARAGRRVLLVLDNAATAEQVRPLLPADGSTAALVTSRHTLDLDARLHELRVLPDRAGVALLDEVLRRARPGDTRIADAPDDALALAGLCAGLPLALRITAALLADSPARPLASLVQALAAAHTRLDRLRREDRAVRAAFDLSYRALGPAHARLFRLLPLNPGPEVATESAAHLLGEGDDPYPTEELLQDLARAHLVEPGHVWGRWRLHDLVRLHADEHGRAEADADARDAARSRLHRHLAATTRAAGGLLSPYAAPERRFADRGAALDWLDAERGNLIALAVAEPPLGDPGTTVDLAFALSPYLEHRRFFDDWALVASAALTVLHSRRGGAEDAARLMVHLGSALLKLRRFDEAVTVLSEARSILEGLGDSEGAAAGANALGSALAGLRRFGEAVDALTYAADLSRRLGDRRREAGALLNTGGVLHELRRFEEAAETHTRLVAVYRGLGDPHGEAAALNNLGLDLRELRRFEESVEVAERSVRVHREIGDPHGEAMALANHGLALFAVRRFGEAARAQSSAAEVFRDLADPSREAETLGVLTATLRELRRFDEAVDVGGRAVALHREVGDRYGEATASVNLAHVLHDVRRVEESADACARAAASFAELGDRHGEGAALTGLGIALGTAGRPAEAVDAATRGVAAYRAVGDRRGEAIALANVGAVLRGTERSAEAVALCGEAVSILRELGDRHGEATALMTLGVALEQSDRAVEAIEAVRRAVELFRTSADLRGEARASFTAGRLLAEAERYEEAVAVLTAATGAFDLTGDRAGEAGAWADLGSALDAAGRPEEAVPAFGRAAELYEALGDLEGVGGSLSRLGSVLQRLGRFEDASEVFAVAAEAWAENGDEQGGAELRLAAASAHNEGWLRGAE
ncbi:tetratricopeptide repeat protein [Kitasatospora misakiensis]|uniref:Tetratricopeptide repeat protein n=1 Tax=Kitasatospora misakiensis TaxID=67330 RepID=A0ABW0XI11_9ACTN